MLKLIWRVITFFSLFSGAKENFKNCMLLNSGILNIGDENPGVPGVAYGQCVFPFLWLKCLEFFFLATHFCVLYMHSRETGVGRLCTSPKMPSVVQLQSEAQLIRACKSCWKDIIKEMKNVCVDFACILNYQLNHYPLNMFLGYKVFCESVIPEATRSLFWDGF